MAEESLFCKKIWNRILEQVLFELFMWLAGLLLFDIIK